MDSQAIGAAAAVTTAASPMTQQGNASLAKAAETLANVDPSAEIVAAREQQDIRQRDSRSLQYQVDRATHRIVATITDGNKTVIRQVPDAEVLRIARAIDRMQGFLITDKA